MSALQPRRYEAKDEQGRALSVTIAAVPPQFVTLTVWREGADPIGVSLDWMSAIQLGELLFDASEELEKLMEGVLQ